MGNTQTKGYKHLKAIGCNADVGFNPEQVKEIFKLYDTNKDNQLDRKEATAFFTDYLKAKGIKSPPQSEIDKLFNKFDLDKNGVITWEELNTLSTPVYNRHKSTEEKREEEKKKALASLDTKKAEEKKAVPVISGLDRIFNQYAVEEGEQVEQLFGDGLTKFFQDIGVDSADEVHRTLITMWKCEAAVTGEISREEFKKAFAKCTTMADIKGELEKIVRSVETNQRKEQEMYSWCYNFYLDDDAGKRVLEPAFAEEGWSGLIFKWTLYSKWSDFITAKQQADAKPKPIRYITKDQWDAVFMLSKGPLKADLSNLDDVNDGTWPSLLDDFFEYCQEHP